MTEDLLTRARELAVYIIENRATIRQAAKHFGLSKSTVHKDLSEPADGEPRAVSFCAGDSRPEQGRAPYPRRSGYEKEI